MEAWELAERLNERALQMLAEAGLPNEPLHALAALRAAAQEAGLEEIGPTSAMTELWRAPDGTLVNLWLEGPMSQGIAEGGAGFDDQVGPGDLERALGLSGEEEEEIRDDWGPEDGDPWVPIA